MQDCSDSIANALELMQLYAKWSEGFHPAPAFYKHKVWSYLLLFYLLLNKR